VSQHTANGYAGDVSIFARWFEDTTGETVAPENVTTVDVREYISYLTNVRCQKPASVARKVRALKNFFDWLVGTGSAKANPATGVRLPRETKRPPKSLTDQELYRVRRAVYRAGNPRDVTVLNCLAIPVSGYRNFVHCSWRISSCLSAREKSLSGARGTSTGKSP